LFEAMNGLVPSRVWSRIGVDVNAPDARLFPHRTGPRDVFSGVPMDVAPTGAA